MKVSTTAELQAALAAGTDPQTIEVTAVDTGALQAEATQAGATAERERILGIQALAVPGFEQEVSAAIDQGVTVEAAGMSLFKAAQDRGITLAGIKGDATKTKTAAPSEGKGGAVISTSAIWAGRKGAKA